jgi:NmrA-like family protein
MLIAVIGATGNQGSSVVDAALESEDTVAVRAVVRNARTDRASALSGRVAEIVEADLDDPETLRRAFAGADAAYCVTPGDGDWGRETTRAGHMALAAHGAKLEHVIWSTQEDTRPALNAAGSAIPVLGGRYRVPQLRRESGGRRCLSRARRSDHVHAHVVLLGELFLSGIGPAPAPPGGAVIRWPLGDAKLPGIAVAFGMVHALPGESDRISRDQGLPVVRQ